ncbi:subtilisin-like protein [Lactarius psammicola]|nr:subtilisin-like protein [Lactarius psammicola]
MYLCVPLFRGRYGAHLSKEQVAELVTPHPDTLELVHSWLGHHNAPSSSVSVAHGGSSLMLAGVPISQANNLLGASYQLDRHAETNETVLRTVGYSLPAALHVHVKTVAPTTCFASPRSQWQAPRNPSGWAATRMEKVASGEPVMALSNRDENDDTTSSFLRWLYRTWGYTPEVPGWNALGVAGFMGQYPSPTDLGLRNLHCRASQWGGYNPSNPHEESNLDIQYTEAMAYPTPHIFYSTDRGLWGRDDSYISWLSYILHQPRIPQTISILYANAENTYPSEYLIRVCYLFAQLAVRGISALVATGDDGVGSGNCMAKDGSGNVQFVPSFPATYTCSDFVGSQALHELGYWPLTTQLLFCRSLCHQRRRNNGLSRGRSETAVSKFFQRLGIQYQGFYNPYGRSIPYISAQALEFPILLNGAEVFMRDTSGATPVHLTSLSDSPPSFLHPSLNTQLTVNVQVVAGIISLLNDYRISQGKFPLGVLNPWLYSRALSGINDITKGSNPGCNTEGFTAISGWDPLTLGSIGHGPRDARPVSNHRLH